MGLIFQWLRLCVPNAGALGSIPGQGTNDYIELKWSRGQKESDMTEWLTLHFNSILEHNSHAATKKILCATTKTQQR